MTKGLILVNIFNVIDIITTQIFYLISNKNWDFKEANILFEYFEIYGFFAIKIVAMFLLTIFVEKYFDDLRVKRFVLVVITIYSFIIASNILSIIFYIWLKN